MTTGCTIMGKSTCEYLVSIITPTFNSAKFVRETIESIIAQTYENWELLITDDGSTDETVAIVQEYVGEDERIKLFRLDTNSGSGIVRNHSIRQAKGRFIAFCDSDDLWTPDKLAVQLKFMLENDIAFSYGSYFICDENGQLTEIFRCLPKIMYTTILMDNFVGCLTAMYDVDKLGKVYMPDIRRRQDWGLWITILKKCGYGLGVKQPIGYYRIRKDSLSGNKLKLIRSHAIFYMTMLHVPLLVGYVLYFFVNLPTYLFKKTRKAPLF